MRTGSPLTARTWFLNLRDAVIVGGATSAVVVWLFKLWRNPVRVPLLYSTDGISQLVDIKGILDNGWYQKNPMLGYPIGLDHRDFSLGSDNLHYLAIKVLGVFSHDAVLVSNAYFFLSFVAVALVTYFVVRYFELSRPAAFVVALLYTFLPYHFLRGTWHLQLAAYWTVPISCLLTVLIWNTAPPFFRLVDGRAVFTWRDRRVVWFVLAAVVIAMTGVYYMAFSISLMLMVGLLRVITTRGVAWRSLAAAGILTLVMGVTTVINTAPSLLYWRDHGKNDEVATRTVQESDIYALRPIQMLSPIPEHRLEPFASIADEVRDATPGVEATQWLGLVGALGFLGLMVVLLGVGRPRPSTPDGPPLVLRLASLSALAVLIGVTGGLSWFVGLSGLTEIRAWNRISIFIAFYALLAVGIFLDHLVTRVPGFRWKRAVVAAGAIVLVGVGILDQTSPAILPDTSTFATEWNSDAEFVGRIEQTLGPDQAVFQLPYLPYPEAQLDLPPYGMQDYDPFRGYVHSDSLRWSYGAIRGRAGDWESEVVKQPTTSMLDAITSVGYRGLWIDTLGYPQGAADIEAEITALTGEEPIRSPNGRFLFFDLRPYARSVEQRLGRDGTAELRSKTLRDVG